MGYGEEMSGEEEIKIKKKKRENRIDKMMER